MNDLLQKHGKKTKEKTVEIAFHRVVVLETSRLLKMLKFLSALLVGPQRNQRLLTAWTLPSLKARHGFQHVMQVFYWISLITLHYRKNCSNAMTAGLGLAVAVVLFLPPLLPWTIKILSFGVGERIPCDAYAKRIYNLIDLPSILNSHVLYVSRLCRWINYSIS